MPIAVRSVRAKAWVVWEDMAGESDRRVNEMLPRHGLPVDRR